MACGNLFPDQGSSLGPLHRRYGALVTGFFPLLPLGVPSSPQGHIAYHLSQASPSFCLPGSPLSLCLLLSFLPLFFPFAFLVATKILWEVEGGEGIYWPLSDVTKVADYNLCPPLIWKNKLLLKEDTKEKELLYWYWALSSFSDGPGLQRFHKTCFAC